MKKLLFILLPIFILLTGLVGCDKDDQKDNKNPQTDILKLGYVASLNFKESVAFLSEEKDMVTVSFEKVEAKLNPAFGGGAIIELSMLYQDNKYTIPITTKGCLKDENNNLIPFDWIYKDTLMFHFSVLQIDPCVNKEPIDPNEYKLQIRIEKQDNSPKDTVPMGDAVLLNSNESVVFLSNQNFPITVSFTLMNDLRGSDCLGSAFVEILMQQNNEIDNIPIEVLGCSENLNGNFTDLNIQKDTLGYLFTVLQLNPRPGWEIYPSSWYKLKFKIEKS
jgi:hypothetical protein